VRHGKLVFEAYASGADWIWGTDVGVVAYDAAMPHDVRSVTKSVVSLLFGIALDAKLIAGIDEPVLSFFPDYPDLRTPEKQRILLHHLLTMTDGLFWNESVAFNSPLNDERQMYASPDQYRYVLERRVGYAPGTRWEYSSGATALLGKVIEKATGMRLDVFARQVLFEPLGIREVDWMTLANSDPIAGGGLRLRPRDMAKIGQLILNGGEWKGRRIVSAEWVKQSIEPRFEGWSGMRYGYQWWSGFSKTAGGPLAWIAAIGLGGQRIFIVPALDLVLVSTAGLYRAEAQGYYARAILEDDVIPTIGHDGPSAPPPR